MKEIVWTALLVAAFATGCDDPSKSKTSAEVGSAKAESSAKVEGATYELDASASKISFVGSKVTGKHDGGFKKFTGTATVGDSLEAAKVSVEIDIKSTYSDSDRLTGHLLEDDFFAAEKHPTAKFVTTDIKAGGDGGTHTITGNLTLRGKTKSISFPAKIDRNGDAIKVTSEFSINRKDFDIMYAGKEDDLIRDGVVIKLDLSLTKT